MQLHSTPLPIQTHTMDSALPSSSSLYILVIAHPDDECMFFLPTLRHFIHQQNAQVWVVCLSNGNYNGTGTLREVELQTACRIVGVQTCLCVNVLPDDPCTTWPATTIAQALNEVLLRNIQQAMHEFSTIHVLTFDQGGVSGHVNHVDTYRGVQYWLSHHQHTLLPLQHTRSDGLETCHCFQYLCKIYSTRVDSKSTGICICLKRNQQNIVARIGHGRHDWRGGQWRHMLLNLYGIDDCLS